MKSAVVMADQRGFTLHEVLVAIVISSLLIGFGLSIFLFSQKLLIAREQASDLRAVVDRTLHVLSMDIEQSCRIEQLSDSALVIHSLNQRVVTYRFDGMKVERNGVPMHDEALHIKVAITDLARLQASVGNLQVFQIRVAGEGKRDRYFAETIALLPWSSRQAFTSSSSRAL